MKTVVKLGGTLLDDDATRKDLAAQIAMIAHAETLAVVHGGGKQVSRFLAQRGIESVFVNGLRVSDAAVIDAVTSVIAGSINTQLVSSLIGAGVRAVGLSGVDGGMTRADQLSAELGFVGRPLGTDPQLLDLLTTARYLPVIACIAGDDGGHVYNVNADQMAVSCAVGWQAERLIFLTDVPGVRTADGCVARNLTRAQALQLIAEGVAQGGMQAKLEAAIACLESGVRKVVIASGREAGVCGRILADESVGTDLALQSTGARLP